MFQYLVRAILKGCLPPKWNIAVVLLTWCLVAHIGSTKRHLIGQNTTLDCRVDFSLEGDLPPSTYTWNKHGEGEERTLILTYVSGVTTFKGPLSERARFEPPLLHIRNLKVSDTGTYSCRVIGTTVKTSSTKLEVNAIPVVEARANRFPTVDEKSGLYGAATCQATGGKPPANIKWIYTATGEVQKSNESLDTRDDGTFNVKSKLLLKPGLIGRFANSTDPVTAKDWRKNFTCNVQHEHFSRDGKQTMTVSISLMYSPVISITMDSNKLTCKALGNPKPSLVWTRPDGRTEVGKESIFVNQSTPTASSGRYVCLARSIIGPDAVAAINVQKPKDLPTLFTNTVRYNASLPLKAQGYEMECTAELESMEKVAIKSVHFVWTKDGNPIVGQSSAYTIVQSTTSMSREKSLVRTSLRIISVERYRDEGVFKCRLSLPAIDSGYVRVVERSIHVDVDYPPAEGSVITYAYPHTTIREGVDVVLSCKATSSPPSSYRWFFDGTVKFAGPRLLLRNISRTQAGIYKCVAFNYVPGSAFKEVRLVVNYPPGRVVISKVKSGLSCTVEGGSVPEPIYTWLLPNGTMTGENISVLEIPTFNVASSVSYTCLVGNRLQQTSNSTFHLKAMQIGGIGSLSTGEFVVSIIVGVLLLVVLLAMSVWIFRRWKCGDKFIAMEANKNKKSSDLLEYTEHPFGGSALSISAPRNVFDQSWMLPHQPKRNGSGNVTHTENGCAEKSRYDASELPLSEKSATTLPRTDEKSFPFESKSVEQKDYRSIEKLPSKYRSMEVLDSLGTPQKDTTIPRAAVSVLPNSLLRMATFSQAQYGVGEGRGAGKSYFTTRNPHRAMPKEQPLQRASSENFRPVLFDDAVKITKCSNGAIKNVGAPQPPQYSRPADRKMMLSPRPMCRSNLASVGGCFRREAKDDIENGKSSDSLSGSTTKNKRPDAKHRFASGSEVVAACSNNTSHTNDCHDQLGPQKDFIYSPAPSRCQSVDPSYSLACTPPMDEIPTRNYLYRPFADPRKRLPSLAPKTVQDGSDSTTENSPYDTGSDSMTSGTATKVTSSGGRMQSLTLV